jgi:hypothetical protein
MVSMIFLGEQRRRSSAKRRRSPGESYGKVGVNARLLDGYAERDSWSFIEGREVPARPMDNTD